MFKDFREYLDYLEKKGKLLKVKQAVDIRYEIAAGIRKISALPPAQTAISVTESPTRRIGAGSFSSRSDWLTGSSLSRKRMLTFSAVP